MAITISVEELGDQLKKARKERDLNLKKVEKETGISPSTLSRIERGHTPDIGAIKKLAKWLNVNVQAAGEKESTIEDDNDLKKVIEVHLRAKKNLSDEAAKSIAKTVEAFLAFEINKTKSMNK